jgi:hypothetical protein
MEEKYKSVIENERDAGWYNEFLWWCAGVNRNILKQCPTEWAKYAGMGGTIFSTACMAALSGGYAISTVFDDTVVAILFGLFWGFVIIFNLDRLIVNTMYSDGEVTISWKEFYSGLPRIIMAIFLGIVISTPMELKIYEKSIESEIENLKEKELKEFVAKDEAKLAEKELKFDEVSNMPLTDAGTMDAEDVFTDAYKERQTLITQRDECVRKIRDYNTRRRNISQVDNSQEYQKLTDLINSQSRIRNDLNRKIDDLSRTMNISKGDRRSSIDSNRKRRDEQLKVIQNEINELNNHIKNAQKVYAPTLSKKYDGFQGRMDAFHSLKYPAENLKYPWYSPKRYSSPTCIAALFISLLFIIIECAPTFMRMMVADGSYEKILEAERHRIRVISDKRISDLNDEINTEIQISTQKNKERFETEVKANKELMEKIAKTQAELLNTAIERWREEELAKINEDPSLYIKSNSAS